MKIEDQLCTAEQAHRLRTLGVTTAAYFSFACEVKAMHQSFNGEYTEWEAEHKEEPTICESSLAVFDGLPHVGAYSAAELGEMIPGCYALPDRFNGDKVWKGRHADYGSYPTEAQARAGLLIYLLERNYFSADSVNEKMQKR